MHAFPAEFVLKVKQGLELFNAQTECLMEAALFLNDPMPPEPIRKVAGLELTRIGIAFCLEGKRPEGQAVLARVRKIPGVEASVARMAQAAFTSLELADDQSALEQALEAVALLAAKQETAHTVMSAACESTLRSGRGAAAAVESVMDDLHWRGALLSTVLESFDDDAYREPRDDLTATLTALQSPRLFKRVANLLLDAKQLLGAYAIASLACDVLPENADMRMLRVTMGRSSKLASAAQLRADLEKVMELVPGTALADEARQTLAEVTTLHVAPK